MDFIPERSELQVENLELKDKIVREMVKEIGLKKLIPGKKREWSLFLTHSLLPLSAEAWVLAEKQDNQ